MNYNGWYICKVGKDGGPVARFILEEDKNEEKQVTAKKKELEKQLGCHCTVHQIRHVISVKTKQAAEQAMKEMNEVYDSLPQTQEELNSETESRYERLISDAEELASIMHGGPRSHIIDYKEMGLDALSPMEKRAVVNLITGYHEFTFWDEATEASEYYEVDRKILLYYLTKHDSQWLEKENYYKTPNEYYNALIALTCVSWDEKPASVRENLRPYFVGKDPEELLMLVDYLSYHIGGPIFFLFKYVVEKFILYDTEEGLVYKDQYKNIPAIDILDQIRERVDGKGREIAAENFRRALQENESGR